MEIISKNMHGYNIIHIYILYIYTYHSVYILGLYDAIHIHIYIILYIWKKLYIIPYYSKAS